LTVGNRFLAQSIDIHHFLEQDRALRLSERAARDRAIGKDIARSGSARTDSERVLAWWQAIQSAPHGPVQRAGGERVVTVRRWLNIVLILAGLFIGGSVCSVALAYDGRYPVNLLAFVGVMVGLPMLLLAFTLLAMGLRTSGMGRAEGAALTGWQVNSWLLGLWERLSGSRWQSGFGQSDARARFAYWQVLSFSQLFSVGFFAGALVMLMVLVAVTDLAFGWSTTLRLDAAEVHSWFVLLSAPWSGFWPDAAPSLSLVETSRYFRLEGDMGEVRAARLGEWWPFVLMVLLVWGLAPRVAMLGLCSWRVASASRELLREHSEVTALLDRMATPALALGEDVHTSVPEAGARGEVAALHNVDDARIVVWNEAVAAAGKPLRLGSLLNDSELRAAISGMEQAVPRVLVLVKAWEPPMLEVLDMLQLLRRHLGEASSILVTPVGLPEQSFTPAAEDVDIWSAAVAKLKDAHTYVAQAQPGLIAVEPQRG